MQYSEQEQEDALTRRDLSALTNMINDGVDINSLVVPKNTDILLAAINKENKSFFNAVLANGFKCKNQNGFLYLHHAIRTHDLFFIKKIVEKYKKENIDINELTSSNDNCLHIAAGENGVSFEILSYLNSCSIKWDDKNNDGQTPLHVLLEKNNVIPEDIVLLVKNVPSVFNIKDNMGLSPLDLIKSYSLEWAESNKPLIEFIKEAF